MNAAASGFMVVGVVGATGTGLAGGAVGMTPSDVEAVSEMWKASSVDVTALSPPSGVLGSLPDIVTVDQRVAGVSEWSTKLRVEEVKRRGKWKVSVPFAVRRELCIEPCETNKGGRARWQIEN